MLHGQEEDEEESPSAFSSSSDDEEEECGSQKLGRRMVAVELP
eukprot:COSAG01_NODE_4632_length_4861_cov_2.222596_1_plen_43_part_00